MIKDVMVFCPVYRLEPETVDAIFALEWDGPITYHFQRDNPYVMGVDYETERETGVRNHLHQYQRGRDLFLRGDYDAMLVIESDIIPPPDALKRLAAIDTDLAYGAYLFRVSPVVNIMERYQEGALNIGESLTVRGKWEWAKAQGVVPCSGAGFGCVLIKRHVLEAVEMRVSTLPSARVHCDSWFTCDVYERGFRMMADCGVICGHKKEDGEIIWPS
jgi:hypothetical protein